MWNSGGLVYSALQNVAPKDVKAEYFAKKTIKSKFLRNLIDK